MTITLPKTASFGGTHTGLVGTAGVAILNADGTVHTARTIAGIYEIGGGCYGKEVTFADNFKGSLKWDTGGGTPVYAVEEYIYYENNPIVDDIYTRIGAPDGASIAADLVTIDNFVDELESRLTAARAGYLDNLSAGAVALAATALTNTTWTDAKAGFIDVAISGRAPANEYDTQMGYIPSNLADVPTATELIAAHGSGAWTTADVSALATATSLKQHDAKITGFLT